MEERALGWAVDSVRRVSHQKWFPKICVFPAPLLAVELGLQASRHSLDLDRALALNLWPALSGQLLVEGSWSKSKSKIMIKKMAKAQFWHYAHPPLFPTESTARARVRGWYWHDAPPMPLATRPATGTRPEACSLLCPRRTPARGWPCPRCWTRPGSQSRQ